tara:strand:- start:20445 stop:21755 length:1311 start_codon:yes stop_codon:yes gene_type:complete
MAQFRKILLSGSNAHVSQVTASILPDVSNNSNVLFADNTSGQIEKLSTLTYSSTGNELQFEGGTFSGSFSGDGSELTGVTGELGFALVDGAGVKGFSYDGSAIATASLDLSPNGGLTFYNGSTDAGTATGAGTDDFTLGITSSLPGDGLDWQSQYNKLQIDLDGTSNGTSGLKTGSSGLALSDNIDGNGLSLGSGILQVDLANQGGLKIDSAKLRLTGSLPGTGLEWGTQYSALQIDSTVVVDSGNTIEFTTGSNNITINLKSDTTVTNAGSGSSTTLIGNPHLELNVSDTLTGNFTFNDDLTVKGDFVVEGNSNTVNLETQNLNIADQFILVNSGSANDGGFIVSTTDANGAFFFYDNTKNRWGVSTEIAKNTTAFTAGTTANTSMIAVVQVTGSVESTFIGGNGQFGTDSNSRIGQIMITTAAATNESSTYIYA